MSGRAHCRLILGLTPHLHTPRHLRQMLVVGENAGKHIDQFSQQFKSEFLLLLSRRYNTQRVRANQVYQEYIQDKHHLHMNATRWVTLSEFVKYLGREGICRVDENEKGFWISWVDNSPKALQRQAELQKRERADMDEEQRQRKQLKEQIERARLQAEAREMASVAGGGADKFEGLKREEAGEKLTLSLGGLGAAKPKSEEDGAGPSVASTLLKSTATAESDSKPAASSASVGPAAAATFSLSAGTNPLKRPAPGFNAFKQAAKSMKTSATDTASGKDKRSDAVDTRVNLSNKKFLTAAEKLMLEDMEREKRKAERSRGGGYQGMGPQRAR